MTTNKDLLKYNAYYWRPTKEAKKGIVVIAFTVKEAKVIGEKYWREEFPESNCFLRNRANLLTKNIWDLNFVEDEHYVSPIFFNELQIEIEFEKLDESFYISKEGSF